MATKYISKKSLDVLVEVVAPEDASGMRAAWINWGELERSTLHSEWVAKYPKFMGVYAQGVEAQAAEERALENLIRHADEEV